MDNENWHLRQIVVRQVSANKKDKRKSIIMCQKKNKWLNSTSEAMRLKGHTFEGNFLGAFCKGVTFYDFRVITIFHKTSNCFFFSLSEIVKGAFVRIKFVFTCLLSFSFQKSQFFIKLKGKKTAMQLRKQRHKLFVRKKTNSG